ncbi:MAG: EAL domain-containing protein [Acidimicrobiales bacterium]|nr:EAL domain-containing protein [Acidimicrobiales bacterium]
MFDAVGAAVVVLAHDGTVLDANRAWDLRRMVGSSLDGVGPGGSYLEYCDRLAAGGVVAAGRVSAGVRSVLAGHRGSFELEYAGTSSSEERWTELRASATADGGAVLTFRDVTDRRLLAEVVASLSGHDAATGLLDRAAAQRAVADRLGHVRTHGGRLAVTRIAFPRLTEVVAQHGDLTAAALTVRAAARIRKVIRADDLLCRTGEGDFTVICAGLGEAGLDALDQRLREVLAGGYEVSGRWVEEGVVVAQVQGAGTVTAAELLRQADEALQAALAGADVGAGDRVAPAVRPGMLAPVADAVEAAGDTAARGGRALGPELDDRLSARFRAVVRATDGEVVGIEVVPVLDDGDGELLIADEARSAATAAGWGRAMSLALLRRTLAAGAAWQRQVPDRFLSMGVELTRHDLMDRDLASRIADELDRSGLEPVRLVLGLSEQLLMEDPRRSHRQLAQLKMVGVELLVDGFATGRGSIPHLARFPVDYLRIDVGAEQAEAELAPVLSAIAGVADALGLRVIADGLGSEGGPAVADGLRCGYAMGDRWMALDGLPETLLDAGRRHPSLRPLAVDERPRRPQGFATLPAVEGPTTAAAGPATATEAAVEELDLIFRALVHELRTPLTVAMGYASLIEASDDDDTAATGQSIRRATERINRLLGNLEDIRMIDQGTLVLDERELDLRAVVVGQVEELRDVLGIDVRIRADDGAPLPVVADELRIGQVLTNLITNAARYTSPGTAVEVRLWVEGGQVEVGIVDDGPGVPPDRFEHIFEKYGRADDARAGSGLGLYLARGIARAHGGEVTYRRRTLRSGSVFALHLPLAADAIDSAIGDL